MKFKDRKIGGRWKKDEQEVELKATSYGITRAWVEFSYYRGKEWREISLQLDVHEAEQLIKHLETFLADEEFKKKRKEKEEAS